MKPIYVKIGVVIAAIVLIATGVFLFSDESEGGKIEKLGDVVEDGAKTGLVVPEYVVDELGIESIADLGDHAGAFDGKIVGIDAGAGIMSSTERAIEVYGLGFSLSTSSESAMLTALDIAYTAKTPIVVTLWEPHWIMGSEKYDLVFLEDPELVYGESESIQSYGRPGLADEDPVLAGIMERYGYETKEFASLLAYIDHAKNDRDVEETVAAAEWVEANPDLLETWLDGVDDVPGRGTVKIGLVSWACAIGSSNALKHVLEEVGYTVELKYLDAGPMYEGLSRGSIDVTTTVWYPLTHASYLDRYA